MRQKVRIPKMEMTYVRHSKKNSHIPIIPWKRCNIWRNILNILRVDLKEIWGIIFGPEALSSGSYQIFIQITKTKKFGKYLKYFIKEQSNISKEIFSCACGDKSHLGRLSRCIYWRCPAAHYLMVRTPYNRTRIAVPAGLISVRWHRVVRLGGCRPHIASSDLKDIGKALGNNWHRLQGMSTSEKMHLPLCCGRLPRILVPVQVTR